MQTGVPVNGPLSGSIWAMAGAASVRSTAVGARHEGKFEQLPDVECEPKARRRSEAQGALKCGFRRPSDFPQVQSGQLS
jgi:hypothetical protein